MIKTEYLDINRIIEDKKILKLFQAVTSHGGILRFVGGAVRDVLAGLKGFELDLATDLSPDELVEACLESGLKTVPIGLKFATTGVVINNKILEVSSLVKNNHGYKLSSDFEFTDDWNADAAKRDLTINAVYADENGNVFDYYNGISDLEAGIIRFIGNAEEKIKENPIRIMRFFRFYSIFGKGMPDLKSLKACVENKDLLRTEAIEQVRDELFKIFLTPNIVHTLRIIFENDVLSYILPTSNNLKQLDTLNHLITINHLTPDPLRRLYILYLPNEILAENLAMRLHLTKKQKSRLTNWAKIDFDSHKMNNLSYLKKMSYLYGKDFCRDKILFAIALMGDAEVQVGDLFNQIDQLIIPEFPLRGKDMINMGFKNFSKIGTILEDLKQIWLKNDFNLSESQLKDEALAMINNQK